MTQEKESMVVTVSILGHEYKLSCLPQEESSLKQAAALVDDKMRELRGDGQRPAVQDRVSIMTALTLAHDLIRTRDELAALTGRSLRHLNDLYNKTLDK